jgi:TrmH family RNA methyltransferase
VSPGEPISSRHNPRFRSALALRDGAERRARGLTLVDGVREIARALDAGARVTEAWVAAGVQEGEEARGLATLLERSGAVIIEAAPELLGRLAYGERRSDLVAVVEVPSTGLSDLELPAGPLVAVLEGLEKPGNIGAVIRSADGAGLDAVILADATSDPWHPNAIRASLGTVFGMAVAVCRTRDARSFLHDRGIRIVAARVDGAVELDRADLTGPLAVVLGSEAAGLSEQWRGPDVTSVRIPMLGRGDSLNVSASAAVLFYEALRQRRRQAGPTGGRGPAR